jgi:hypothetical protein
MDVDEPPPAGGAPEQRTLHLDWHDDPPRYRPDVHLPPRQPGSREAAEAEAQARVRAAIGPLLESGWELDGDPRDVVSIETRTRQVLLPTPGMAGPRWTELVGADVQLHRRSRAATPVAQPR